MAGREGLINTAMKTAETSYIQHRLVKALGNIMDGAFMENLDIETFSMTDKQFKHGYRVDVDPAGGSLPGVLIISNWSRIENYFENSFSHRRTNVPVNVNRIAQDALEIFRIDC
jgi:DNA-directed RNA polymerase II subunit RPB1